MKNLNHILMFLYVDLDLNENVENANGLDRLHMSGSFFTMGDIDQIEN